MNHNEVQVIITCGNETPEKAVLGFAFALSIASTGTRVHMFFTMKGATWVDKSQGNEVLVHGFEPISNYWDMLSEMDVIFEGCTTCVENYCNEQNNQCTFRKNLVMAGLSTAAIRGINMPTYIF
ncbi:MAG: DsrE family protein [Bacteroidia bacterium]|nr:DsrE family protein [Bacteroidia bacterium]